MIKSNVIFELKSVRDFLNDAIKCYNIEFSNIKLVKYNTNIVYKAYTKSNEVYCIKIFKKINSTLSIEFEWLHLIENMNISPKIIYSKQNSLYTIDISGKWILVIYSWLDGISIDKNDINVKYCLDLSKLMVKLHTSIDKTSNMFSKVIYQKKLDYFEECFDLEKQIHKVLMNTELNKSVNLIIKKIKYANSKIGYLYKNVENYGLIHGDLNVSNCLYVNKQLYAIDFEKCGLSTYLYDFVIPFIDLYIYKKDLSLFNILVEEYNVLRNIKINSNDLIYAYQIYILKRIMQYDNRENSYFYNCLKELDNAMLL